MQRDRRIVSVCDRLCNWSTVVKLQPCPCMSQCAIDCAIGLPWSNFSHVLVCFTVRSTVQLVCRGQTSAMSLYVSVCNRLCNWPTMVNLQPCPCMFQCAIDCTIGLPWSNFSYVLVCFSVRSTVQLACRCQTSAMSLYVSVCDRLCNRSALVELQLCSCMFQCAIDCAIGLPWSNFSHVLVCFSVRSTVQYVCHGQTSAMSLYVSVCNRLCNRSAMVKLQLCPCMFQCAIDCAIGLPWSNFSYVLVCFSVRSTVQ